MNPGVHWPLPAMASMCGFQERSSEALATILASTCSLWPWREYDARLLLSMKYSTLTHIGALLKGIGSRTHGSTASIRHVPGLVR